MVFTDIYTGIVSYKKGMKNVADRNYFTMGGQNYLEGRKKSI
jgi:hypothetical protein